MATPEPHLLHAVPSAGGLHWVMLQLSLISEPLWAWGSLSEKIGFTATDAKENQFIFVLIYSLTCKKVPVRWFYILLLVLIVWIKHFHFSINCHTWNFFMANFGNGKLPLFKNNRACSTGGNRCFSAEPNWLWDGRSTCSTVLTPKGRTGISSIGS